MLHAISQLDLVIMLKLAKLVIGNHISPSVFSYHSSTSIIYTIYKLFSHLYKCKCLKIFFVRVFTNAFVIREKKSVTLID